MAIEMIAVITAFSGFAKEPKKFDPDSYWQLPYDKLASGYGVVPSGNLHLVCGMSLTVRATHCWVTEVT